MKGDGALTGRFMCQNPAYSSALIPSGGCAARPGNGSGAASLPRPELLAPTHAQQLAGQRGVHYGVRGEITGSQTYGKCREISVGSYYDPSHLSPPAPVSRTVACSASMPPTACRPA
jgi:hypothetical protein